MGTINGNATDWLVSKSGRLTAQVTFNNQDPNDKRKNDELLQRAMEFLPGQSWPLHLEGCSSPQLGTLTPGNAVIVPPGATITVTTVMNLNIGAQADLYITSGTRIASYTATITNKVYDPAIPVRYVFDQMSGDRGTTTIVVDDVKTVLEQTSIPKAIAENAFSLRATLTPMLSFDDDRQNVHMSLAQTALCESAVSVPGLHRGSIHGGHHVKPHAQGNYPVRWELAQSLADTVEFFVFVIEPSKLPQYVKPNTNLSNSSF